MKPIAICSLGSRFTRATLFTIAGTIAAIPAHAEHISVFLLGGQSNMDGRASASGLPSELQSPQDDVLFYYRGNGSLTTLRPGSGSSFGPEITFGRTLADAMPNERFGLIKHAAGGTDLFDDWDPDTGGTYSGFRNTVSNGLNALTAAGHTYDIVGMLWTQGERDAKAGRTTPQYQADLNGFIADVRTNYGPDLPFFLSRLSSEQTNISPSGLTNIRTAQDNVAAADDHAYLIDTDGMGLKGDNLHFDADGQIVLGQAFAQSYLDTLPTVGDLNGDGQVTNGDISAFVQALTDPSGYASAYPDLDPDTLGDFTGDGTLTNGDIAGFVDALTGNSPASAVPEPGTLALFALGGLIATRRRRR